MTTARAQKAQGGVQTVRRVITYLLLFVMVVIAAIGLSGLIHRLLDAPNTLVAGDTSGLAQSLAFSLIAGPLAAVLWWLVWRGSANQRDRASVAWALYLALMYTVSLLTFAIALLSCAAALVLGDWRPSELATGVVWALVWLWHRWMLHHTSKRPTRLVGVAGAIGSLIGLVIAVGGAVTALGRLLDAAIASFGNAAIVGGPLWEFTLQPLVWVVGGGLIWWWHWMRDGVREQRTGFSSVLLVFITGFGSLALCLYGIATTLYVALRILVTRQDPLGVILDPLGQAIAAAVIGALVLVYHRRVVAAGPDAVRQATRLVTSGVALAVAASGIGVIVNSILAAITMPLAETGIRPLLLGGISALVVSGPVWWVSWKPTTASDAGRISTPGRRVYLVVIFGISAIVALITLLVIGYQIFSFALDSSTGDSLLERTRAALGLLTATVLVAAYHFALWRKDRASAVSAPAKPLTIEQVILVTGSDPEAFVSAITESTGAHVTVWRRADADDSGPSVEQVVAALGGVDAARVLLVTGSTARVEAIRLDG